MEYSLLLSAAGTSFFLEVVDLRHCYGHGDGWSHSGSVRKEASLVSCGTGWRLAFQDWNGEVFAQRWVASACVRVFTLVPVLFHLSLEGQKSACFLDGLS